MVPTPKRPHIAWALLPTPLLSSVFGCLSHQEVFCRCRVVCSLWRESRAGWTNLLLGGTLQEAEAVLRVSERSLVRSVTVLDCTDCSLFRLVSSLGQLRCMELHQATDKELLHVSSLSTLHALTLRSSKQVSDLGLQHLAVLSDLQELHIIDSLFSSMEGVTAEGMRHVSRLTSLHHLALERCHNMTDEGLRHLSLLCELQSLNLTACFKVTDESLSHITACRRLQQLTLRGCHNITSSGLREGLRRLTSLGSLRCLDLGWTDVVDDVLRELSTLLGLKTLDLTRCQSVTDSGLRHLSVLVALEELVLTECVKVTNEGLRHLAKLFSLRKLVLDRCKKVTDEGLQHMCALPALHVLNLTSCPNVTAACVARLSVLFVVLW